MDACNLPEYPPVLRALEETRRGEKWARRALEGEVAIVAGAMSGTRNSTLNTAAFRLGRKVGAGYLRADEVEAALMEAAQRSGLVQEDGPEAVLATIASGLTAGLQEPEHPQDRPNYRAASRGAANIQPTPPHNPFLEVAVPRASRFFPASNLAGKPVPPREWLVPDLVPSRTVTLLGGDGGTGKSLLALQLAYAVATGGTWIGRSVASGGVMFLSAEDDEAELHRRLVDIAAAEGGALADLDRLTVRSFAGEDALLARADGHGALLPSPLFREIDERVADERPALLALDTLADVFGGNENDRREARQFVGMLRGLAIRYGLAVLVLAHPSLSGLNSGSGTSGSTGWNNSVRSRLYLERVIQDGYEANPDARVLSTRKANYGRAGGEINLKWEAGVFVAEAQPTGLDTLAVGAKAERVFLKLLTAFAAQGRRVNGNGGPAYAPKMFAESAEAEGVTKRALRAAMDALYTKGKIRNEMTGPASRPVTYIVLGDA